MQTMTPDEVEHVNSAFEMPVEAGVPPDAPVHGFVGWFDVTFTGRAGLEGHKVVLSTVSFFQFSILSVSMTLCPSL